MFAPRCGCGSHLDSSMAAAQVFGIQNWHCLTLNLSHALVGGNACGPLDVWLKIRRRTPAVMKAKLHIETEGFHTAANSCQGHSRLAASPASLSAAPKTEQSMMF